MTRVYDFRLEPVGEMAKGICRRQRPAGPGERERTRQLTDFRIVRILLIMFRLSNKRAVQA
jgi:hypothetical protein